MLGCCHCRLGWGPGCCVIGCVWKGVTYCAACAVSVLWEGSPQQLMSGQVVSRRVVDEAAMRREVEVERWQRRADEGGVDIDEHSLAARQMPITCTASGICHETSVADLPNPASPDATTSIGRWWQSRHAWQPLQTRLKLLLCIIKYVPKAEK